jgi:ATP adenylyltransferase
MDRLWSPWRYNYVAGGQPSGDCPFCEIGKSSSDRENFVLFRGLHNFVVLNRYPYTTGHLMIVPYIHVPTIVETAEETITEMMLLTRASEKHLREAYRPKGLNVGMNVGEAAGAGVAGHIHMHVLPRWPGDVNFMTAIGETRVLIEELPATWEKLSRAFTQ